MEKNETIFIIKIIYETNKHKYLVFHFWKYKYFLDFK